MIIQSLSYLNPTMQNQSSTKKNYSFGNGKLTVTQKAFTDAQEVLGECLEGLVKKMPDGDELSVSIEPIGYRIKTKYIPGAKAPKGAEKVTCITTAEPSSRIKDTVKFVEDLNHELQKSEGFSFKSLVANTRLLLGQGFNQLFTRKSGLIDYIKTEDVYLLGKSGEKIKNQNRSENEALLDAVLSLGTHNNVAE